MKKEVELCVGPMSKNCIDAAIEFAYEYEKKITLIASRRQIDCKELGGGYVNNWNTLSFSKYVKDKDPECRVILARDHGGPWQNTVELLNCSTIEDAMGSAKLSLKTDIEAGFSVLHLDPVVSRDGEVLENKVVLNRVFELYKFCMDTAANLGKNLLIEIGTEEQQEKPLDDPKNLDYILGEVNIFCAQNGYRMPEYVVVQTGTKVMEMTNVGDFPTCKDEILSYINKHNFKQLVEIKSKYGVKIKQHNTDYLSNRSLQFLSLIGIDAVNVAPEFGVIETKRIVELLDEYKLHAELDALQMLCIESGAWKKWMLKDSRATDREKMFICGHYSYSNNIFLKIKQSLECKMNFDGRSLDYELRNSIKNSILRYNQYLAG